jgi:hypothetical protein
MKALLGTVKEATTVVATKKESHTNRGIENDLDR